MNNWDTMTDEEYYEEFKEAHIPPVWLAEQDYDTAVIIAAQARAAADEAERILASRRGGLGDAIEWEERTARIRRTT